MFLFVIWGRRRIAKTLGYVADYCVVCRKITKFEVIRTTIANHIFFIPIETPTLLGTMQSCQKCAAEFDFTPDRFKSLAKHSFRSVDELSTITFPSVYETFRERLEIERQLKIDPNSIDPQIRAELMMEVFRLALAHCREGSRSEGMRLLIIALRPLNPTADEIRDCLVHTHRLESGVRTADLMRHLFPERFPVAPGTYDY